MSSIEFDRPLYTLEGLDGLLPLPDIHGFMSENDEIRFRRPGEFRERVYGLLETAPFSPTSFTPGRLWHVDLMVERNPYSEQHVREAVRSATQELTSFFSFAQGGQADHLLVYVDDENPDDPIVYADNFESYLNEELVVVGTFGSLLDRFRTYDQLVAELDRQSARWDTILATRSD
ncbi:MAG: hypothetical protein ACRBK7_18060 [Acidimicrobiales bacterium]